MRKNTLLFGLLITVIYAIGLMSCSPDYQTNFEAKILRVEYRDLAQIDFNIDGGSKSIAIETNVAVEDWEAKSNADWCLVDKYEDKIVISAGNNELFRNRKANVTISYGHQSYEIIVLQTGSNPVLLIDGEREGVVKDIDAEGGIFSINVTSNVDIDYVNISDLAPWLKFESVSGSGDDKVVTFLVLANYYIFPRETVVVIQSSENPTYTSSFMVKQTERNWGNLVPITVELRLDMLSANATQDGDGQGLPGLIDDDMGTYYHTLYTGAAPGQKQHYLQIDLDEPVSFISIEYHGRGGGNSPGDVKRAGIWVSESGIDDDSEWSKVSTVNYDMATPLNSRYKMIEEVVYLESEYKYIRFIPEARRNSDPLDSSGSNGWWNMSDFYLYTFDL